VVRVGKKLYVGITRRTSQAGVEGLRSILTPYGYEVIEVRVHGCLHLKSGCSFLGRNMMLMNSSWIDSRPFRGYEIIEVPSNERGGANVLLVADTLVLPKSFPATRQLLERRGFRTKAIDLSELLKAEAGVTCESIVFESDKAGPTKGLR
jgi:dimethylargininase